jgi:hypothetical protein
LGRLDSQGRANVRSSTFRTLRPRTIADGSGIGDLASGAGCAAQCIKVRAVERDSTGTCYDSLGSGPFSQSLSGSNKRKCHKRTWNTAVCRFDLDEVFC